MTTTYNTAGAQTNESSSELDSATNSNTGSLNGVSPVAVGKMRLDGSFPEEMSMSEGAPSSTGKPSSATSSVQARTRSHGNAKERLAAARAIVITGLAGVGKVCFRSHSVLCWSSWKHESDDVSLCVCVWCRALSFSRARLFAVRAVSTGNFSSVNWGLPLQILTLPVQFCFTELPSLMVCSSF